MIDFLNSIDIKLFYFINRTIANRVFDFLMPVITDLNKNILVQFLVLIFLLLVLIRGNSKIRIAVFILILGVAVSDQLSSSIIKYIFLKPRPCHILSNVRLLVSCGSGYSFPSSHAVNNFASAIILSFFFPRAFWWLFGYAFIIAFSRVYVGVHFPSDVIGGGALGIIIGTAIMALYLQVTEVWHKYFKKSKKIRSNG